MSKEKGQRLFVVLFATFKRGAARNHTFRVQPILNFCKNYFIPLAKM